MDYGKYKYIQVDRVGKILRLTLNRPDRLNAIVPEMHTELANIFYDVRFDAEADVITLTGAGRGFCAGADLSAPFPSQGDGLEKLFAEARDIIVNILEIEKPIISGVNGPAAGLGVTLALFPDIVIASDRAKLGDTHVKVGLTAGDGGAVIWPLLIGVNRAKEMLMTGRVIEAQEAWRMGLVNHVVPHDELDQKVMDLAQELVDGHKMAIQSTKKSVNLYLKWMLNQVFDYSATMEYQCALSMASK